MPTQFSFHGAILDDTQTISVPASPQPKAVVWASQFSVPPQISIALSGSAPRIIASDNLSVTGVDLYAWDTSGVAAAATIIVTARGP